MAKVGPYVSTDWSMGTAKAVAKVKVCIPLLQCTQRSTRFNSTKGPQGNMR
ncbi:hypothetical protein CBOM_00254 [Ceraceosorus bombacis]|uniref:Uncharacterized protein n=1 Tax=Ceraceosorus bombacis TaxID=401625 RepID=A0A0P1A4C6_9BASI|nr:hypothetical protein CBOM_00254 [Ceraceosorus bombacis]